MVEIATVVAGVTGVKELVESSLAIIDSIHERLSSSNKAVKAELEKQLTAVREQLPGFGEIAEVAEAYVDALEQVHDLHVDCVILDRFLADNASTLANQLADNNTLAWSTADELLDVIDRHRDEPRKAHQNRQEWFDLRDNATLTPLFNDIDSAFQSSAAFAKARKPEDLRNKLRDMVEALLTARALLRTTLSDNMLKELVRKLRST